MCTGEQKFGAEVRTCLVLYVFIHAQINRPISLVNICYKQKKLAKNNMDEAGQKLPIARLDYTQIYLTENLERQI